jgi:hypothetical protein
MYRLRRIALALAVAALAELPPDRPQSGGVHVAGID